jgi:hypothetical protein
MEYPVLVHQYPLAEAKVRPNNDNEAVQSTLAARTTARLVYEYELA